MIHPNKKKGVPANVREHLFLRWWADKLIFENNFAEYRTIVAPSEILKEILTKV